MATKVLLLSAYDAGSHRYWRTALATMFPQFKWTQLSLPPRNFAWRTRGNSLLWAFNSTATLAQDYDLLIATSMVDLASLRGLLPSLSRIPTLVYFHENQFSYPVNPQTLESKPGFSGQNVEPQLVPIYSALCADRIVFNSQYNRESFLQGCQALFTRLPDKIPANVLDRLACSQVLPVPLIVNLEQGQTLLMPKDPPNIAVLEVVWNHRWEFDKGPDCLLELIRLAVRQRDPIRFHIVGEKFRRIPAEFSEIEELLQQHCENLGLRPGQIGYLKDNDHYHQLLRSCDVVLSTAVHDFQGLAMQHAIAAGCTPLAPKRLAYPEYLEQRFLYSSENTKPEWQNALAKLSIWQDDKARGLPLPKTTVDRFSRTSLQADYAELFNQLLSMPAKNA